MYSLANNNSMHLIPSTDSIINRSPPQLDLNINIMKNESNTQYASKPIDHSINILNSNQRATHEIVSQNNTIHNGTHNMIQKIPHQHAFNPNIYQHTAKPHSNINILSTNPLDLMYVKTSQNNQMVNQHNLYKHQNQISQTQKISQNINVNPDIKSGFNGLGNNSPVGGNPLINVMQNTSNMNVIPNECNINQKISKKLICIDSRFRSGYNETESTNFTFNLPVPVKNTLSLRLASVELPNCWYLFSDKVKSNRIYIEEDSTGISGEVILPEGNYTVDVLQITLEDEINTQLNTSGRFKVVMNPTSGKTTISNTVNTFTMEYRLNEMNPNRMKTLGWYLGYRYSKYIGQDSYTSEGIYNSTATDYIYFLLEDYNISEKKNIIAYFNDSYLDTNIIARIAIASDKFQILFDDGRDLSLKKRVYYGPVNISKLSVKLLDEYGTQIDLNNMDFSFTLEVEIINES
jgi:hypothetical protein